MQDSCIRTVYLNENYNWMSSLHISVSLTWTGQQEKNFCCRSFKIVGKHSVFLPRNGIVCWNYDRWLGWTGISWSFSIPFLPSKNLCDNFAIRCRVLVYITWTAKVGGLKATDSQLDLVHRMLMVFSTAGMFFIFKRYFSLVYFLLVFYFVILPKICWALKKVHPLEAVGRYPDKFRVQVYCLIFGKEEYTIGTKDIQVLAIVFHILTEHAITPHQCDFRKINT